MCVIAYKAPDVKIKEETARDMFKDNSDGAGFCVVHGAKISVYKGYFKFKDLWHDLEQVQDLAVAMHFRKATHGVTNDKMCHPFIVDANEEIATQIEVVTDKPVLFHNGILSHYGDKEISDTLDFVMSTLAPIPDEASRLKLLVSLFGKFLYIEDGQPWYCGVFEEHEGLRVSNTFFVRRWGTAYEKPVSKLPALDLPSRDHHLTDDEYRSGAAGTRKIYPLAKDHWKKDYDYHEEGKFWTRKVAKPKKDKDGTPAPLVVLAQPVVKVNETNEATEVTPPPLEDIAQETIASVLDASTNGAGHL